METVCSGHPLAMHCFDYNNHSNSTNSRAGGRAGPVAQAMAGPIFETFHKIFERPHARAGWKYA